MASYASVTTGAAITSTDKTGTTTGTVEMIDDDHIVFEPEDSDGLKKMALKRVGS